MMGGRPELLHSLAAWAIGAWSFCMVLGCLGANSEAHEPNYEAAQPDPDWLELTTLTMLALERERVANHLAAYVMHSVVKSSQPDRFRWSRRLLGLALTLHSGNPRARAANAALSRKTAAPPIDADHEREVLSRWLFQRSRTLNSGTTTDQRLAPYFMAAAAHMDPHFDDAVLALEKRRLRRGPLDWGPICGESEEFASP